MANTRPLRVPSADSAHCTACECQRNDTSERSDIRLALRPAEAAHALGIGVRLLWSKSNSGEIPCAKIGKRIVYPICLLEEYLRRRATGGTK
jgi:hypothetical protein